MLIRIDKIIPDPGQPRKTFKEETLEELRESVNSLGLISPLTVRPTGDGRYMVIVGERRLRAAKKAGLSEVECIVRNDVDDKKVRETQFAENYHYESIPVLEQARAWAAHMTKYNLRIGQFSKLTGIHHGRVSSVVSIIQLPEPIVDKVESGDITQREAIRIADIRDTTRQKEVADVLAEGKVGGRKIEDFISKAKAEPARPVEDIVDEVVYGVKHVPREELELAKAPETMLDIGFKLEARILDLSQLLTAYDLSRIPAGQRQALIGALKILTEKIRLALEFLTGKKLPEIEGIIEGEVKQIED